MEKDEKDWRKRFGERFVERLQMETDLTGIDGEIEEFIATEIENAKEEGHKEGYETARSESHYD